MMQRVLVAPCWEFARRCETLPTLKLSETEDDLPAETELREDCVPSWEMDTLLPLRETEEPPTDMAEPAACWIPSADAGDTEYEYEADDGLLGRETDDEEDRESVLESPTLDEWLPAKATDAKAKEIAKAITFFIYKCP